MIPWKKDPIVEAGFLDQTTFDIVDFILNEIILDCFLVSSEKRSYSHREIVFKNRLLTECEEFTVASPQLFPLKNNDTVYQIIPKGLFCETFAGKICHEYLSNDQLSSSIF